MSPSSYKHLVIGVMATVSGSFFMIIEGHYRSRYIFDVSIVCQIFAVLIFAVWLAALALRRRPFPSTTLDGPIGLLLVGTSISVMFASDPRISLEALPPFLAAILLFYLFIDIIRHGYSRTVVFAISSVVIACSILMVWEYYLWYTGQLVGSDGTWIHLSRYFGWIPPINHRPSLIVFYNYGAIIIALTWPILIGLLLLTRQVVLRVAIACIGLFLTIPFLLTLSRGAALAAAVGILATLLYVSLDQRRVRPSYLRWIGPIVVVAVFLAVWQADFLVRNFVRPDFSLVTRLLVWLPTVRIILDHPLTGVGLGGYGLALSPFLDDFRAPNSQHAHNGILHVSAELGIGGVVGVGWLLLGTVRSLGQRWRGGGRDERLRLAAAGGALTTLIVGNIFDAYFTFPIVMIPTTFLVAWIVAPAPVKDDALRGRWRLGLFALSGALATLVLVPIDAARGDFEAALAASRHENWTTAEAHLAEAIDRDPYFLFYAREQGLVRGYLAEHSQEGSGTRQFWAGLALAAYQRGEASAQWFDRINLARAAEMAGLLPLARQSAEMAFQQRPYDPVVTWNLGRYRELAGDRQGAIDAYARTIALLPDMRRSPYWSETAARGELMPLVDEAVQQHLANDPRMFDPRHGQTSGIIAQAQAATYAGNVAVATERLDELPGSHSQAASLRLQLARMAGQDDRALAYAKQAFDEMSEWRTLPLAEAAAEYAVELARAGRTAEADQFIALARFYVDDPRIKFRSAQIRRLKGQTAQALADYEASLVPHVAANEDFAANAVGRAPIMPPLLPGVLVPMSANVDLPRRFTEYQEYRAELGLPPVEANPLAVTTHVRP